ncbi:MAG: hypothetical protein ABEL76_08790 [Bradymonadaceae bacterium]
MSALRSAGATRFAQSVAATDGRASSCRVASVERIICKCVRTTVGTVELVSGSVTWTEAGSRWTDLSARLEDGTRIFAGRLRADEDHVEGESIVVLPAETSESPVLRAEQLRRSGTRLRLVSPSWHHSSSIRGAGDHGCPLEVPASAKPSRTYLRADAATQSAAGRRWTIVHLQRDVWPRLRFGGRRSRSNRPTGGFLPPRFSAGRETAELQLDYLVGGLGFGPSLILAPRRWYGLGLRTVTSNDVPGGYSASGPPTMLDAEARWRPSDGTIGSVVEGRLVRGDRHRHVAADVEETTAPSFWRLERTRGDRLFRDWRRSRVGASLSGPAHSLTVRLDHVADQWPARRPVADSLATELAFASDTRLTPWLDAAARLSHESRLRERSEDRHRSLAWTQLAARAGSRDRLFAELSVGHYLSSALEPVGTADPGGDPRGFDALTRTQLLARTAVGASWTGRWSNGIRHRISPRLIGMRELAGYGLRGDSVLPPGPPVRVPEWTAAALVLDQHFGGDATSVDAPLGIALQSRGFDAPVAPRVWSRIDMAATPSLSIQTGGAFGPDGPLDASAGIAWRTPTVGVRATAGASTGVGRLAVGTDRTWGDLWAAARYAQATVVHRDRSLSIYERLDSRLSLGDWTLHAAGWASGPSDEIGATLGWTYELRPAEWALGIEATYASRRSLWGLSAGLMPTGGSFDSGHRR